MSYAKSDFKYIFGPVSSRRFGSSLGIDLSPKKKCCNFDCLYCELPAKRAVAAISEPPAARDILDELKIAIEKFPNTECLTITANGEPSLYPYLGPLIAGVNALKTTQKSLILSNGTAALNESIWAAISELDIVKFSLDSAVQQTFRKIDRGLENIKIDDLIGKMAEFRAVFKGDLVLEILVLDGLNDTSLEFNALNDAAKKIRPNRIDISTLDRPPAHKAAKAVSYEKLQALANHLNAAPTLIARTRSLKNRAELNECELLRLLSLRPQSEFDAQNNLSVATFKLMKKLVDEGKIISKNHAGMVFYRADIRGGGGDSLNCLDAFLSPLTPSPLY